MGVCLFFHRWGPWKQVSPSSPCYEKRECQKCGFTEYKDEHFWDFLRSDPEFPSCRGTRTCKCCGNTETQDLHSYPSTTQVCDICGKQLDAFMNS